MGFFSDLFNRGNRRLVENLMNPLLEMKLQEFVIADDDAVYMKHYFRFNNKEGKDEEFVVVYRRFDPELHYLHTHWKRVGEDPDFRTLSERGPWSIPITYLMELGKRLSATTRPTRGHFVSKVSAGVLRDPNWVPPAAAEPTVKPGEAPLPLAQPKDASPQKPIISNFADEVRKNPKGYAVWMYEPNPGEYAVLLAKLDSKGEMVDGWEIKSLPTRTEQGAFALDVARDLQIKLMDVVRQ